MVAVCQVSYARLHNLGNYENVRFEAVVTVSDGDVSAAFVLAAAAAQQGFLDWLAARDAEQSDN